MAGIAVADGITGVCCTPHTLNGRYCNEADTVRKSCAQLRRRLAEEHIPLDLYPGVEVHVSDNTLGSILDGTSLTLNNNGKYVLLEPPPLELPAGLDNLIFQLQAKGVTTILAHPERVLSLLSSLDKLVPLVEEGLLCQVTGLSVTGEFGPEVRETARTMICCGLAHFIASDAHAETGRSPQLNEAMEQAAAWLGSMEAAEKLCIDNPAAVVAGKELNVPSPTRPRRLGLGEKIKRLFFA